MPIPRTPNNLFNLNHNVNAPVPGGLIGGADGNVAEFGLTTNAFGPVSNGPGIAIIDGQIAADTSTMEGTLDAGTLP